MVTGLYVEHQSALRPSGSSQMEALQVDERITPITTIKLHRTAGMVRHRQRSLKTAGGRSPLIIKDLDLYPQPPSNTRSPTLNSEEPVWRSVLSNLDLSGFLCGCFSSVLMHLMVLGAF